MFFEQGGGMRRVAFQAWIGKRGVAALVTVALVLGVTACGSNDETPAATDETNATTTTNPPVKSGEVKLDYESGPTQFTAAGIWVFPHLEPKAVRINPKSHEIDLTVDLPTYSTGEAAGEGMLWAYIEDRFLTRINPETGAIMTRIDVPGIFLPVVAFGKVWAATNTGEVVIVDPANGKVERKRVQPSGGFELAATDSMVWTLSLTDGLVGLDPTTLATTQPWRPLEVLGDTPVIPLAALSDNLLIATADAVSEVDPIAHKVVRAVDAPDGMRPIGTTTPNADAPQLVWFFYPDFEGFAVDIPRGQPTPDATMARLDLDAGTVVGATVVPFPETQTAASDGQTIWIGPTREPRVVYRPSPLD